MAHLRVLGALCALAASASAHGGVVASRAAAASSFAAAATAARGGDAPRTLGLVPANSLSHFCVVTSWNAYETVTAAYAAFLGETQPTTGIAGGPDSNGTYMGAKLVGTTKIAFLRLNNETQMEFLAGEPSAPSWWRDVYLQKGLEIHHQGYVLPESIDVWATVMNFAESGWGQAVQWGHWGTFGQAGSGCYVYVDSQKSLGVTVELLGGATNCGNLPVSQ